MPTNDGGPAFPGHRISAQENLGFEYRRGMSLRDWFAGQAMREAAYGQIKEDAKIIAEYSYAVADAMLAQREKIDA